MILEPEEFDLLTEDEQDEYLELLSAHLDEPALTDAQKAAMALADNCDELLYGGAAGGGKSFFLRWRAQVLSRQIPGHRCLILRESHPELQRTHKRDSIGEYAMIPTKERPRWWASVNEWRFPNGSVIEFGYCKTDADVKSYLSAEYDAIFIDEASEFTQYRIEMLRSRLRTKAAQKAKGVHLHLILATNPGGIGHKYIKDRYVVPTGYGAHPFVHATDLDDGRSAARTVGFVPASVYDNPYIDQDYVSNLITLPEELRKQYLEGDWDVFEGMYWPDFVRYRERDDGPPVQWHVIDPFPIPHEWPRIRCMDFGYVAPFACLWIAFDQDHQGYVYRELYETGWDAHMQAEGVMKASICQTGGVTKPERVDYTMLDPSCWAQRSSGPTIAGQYAEKGLFCRKANNARIDGWQRVREWLAPVDTNGVVAPGLRVFSTCTNLLSEFANQVHSKTTPEDLDTKAADHALDALRYGLMSYPRRHRPAKAVEGRTMDDRVARRLEKMDRQKRKHPVHPTIGRYR